MIFTEVGFSKENNLHVKLCEMIPFLEKYEYTFLGIFSMDVNNLHRRHSSAMRCSYTVHWSMRLSTHKGPIC